MNVVMLIEMLITAFCAGFTVACLMLSAKIAREGDATTRAIKGLPARRK